MLIGLNADNPMLHDVYRLDLESGAFDKIETNPGYASWLIDSDLAVRGGVVITPDGGAVVHLRDMATGRDEPWLDIPSEDLVTTGVYGFSRDGSTAYLLSSVGVNASRLSRVDLSTGAETVLAEQSEHDVAYVLSDPDTLEPQSRSFSPSESSGSTSIRRSAPRSMRCARGCRARSASPDPSGPTDAGWCPTRHRTGRCVTTCTTGTTRR